MDNDISLSFILNNGVAIGFAWYVLTRINPTLKELTGVITKFNEDIDKRLNAIEANERQTQMKLHELKLKVDNVIRGDN